MAADGRGDGDGDGRAALRAAQLARLNLVIDALGSGRSWYAAHGYRLQRLRSLDELRQWPLLTKDDLARDQHDQPPFGLIHRLPLTEYRRTHQTSGTTREPIKWLDTAADWEWVSRCWQPVLREAGFQPGQSVFFPFSFNLFMGFWSAFSAALDFGLRVVPGGGQASTTRLHTIRMYQPTGLFLTPSHCFRLINVALEEGISLPDLGVSKIVLAGEPGGSNQRIRTRLADAWHCEIYDHYGSTEVGPVGYQCHAHALGFHLNEDEFVFEVIDPGTGRTLPDGVDGELVVTNLGRLGSPLIRYRTGDMVRLSTEPCPCGSHHARCLGGILGRRDDMVVVKGTNVFPGTIESIVREYPEIVEFQCLVRLDLDDPELVLQVEVQRDHEAIVAGLARDIKDILHLSARVQVVPPGALPQFEGKAKRFRRASPEPAALPLDPAAHRKTAMAGGNGAPPAG